jgi:vacuolar-type H+-ATPase subunit C/Vma6
MERTGADAFVYARACGMYAKSFVGERARKLFEVKQLRDLWALLFSDEVPLVPEGMLALLLERKAEERVVAEFLDLVSAYDKPDPVSRALLSVFDYNNLKAASSSLALGSHDKPFMIDTGEFSVIDRTKWPDIAAMTRDSPVAWYNRVPDVNELAEWETRLDHVYYRSLWAALLGLPRTDRLAAERLIREEIILQNIVWALRLRVYYLKSDEEIVPMLAGTGSVPTEADELCKPAVEMLGKQIDVWGDWAGWRYAWMLNPHEEGVPWTVDPRWAQLACDNYLYRLALVQFHQNPFTTGVLVSFFKIKQLEAQMIRVAAEGLRLGANEDQMRDFIRGGRNA